jgi:hypothetical protein
MAVTEMSLSHPRNRGKPSLFHSYKHLGTLSFAGVEDDGICRCFPTRSPRAAAGRVPLKAESRAAEPAAGQQDAGNGNDKQRNQLLPIHFDSITRNSAQRNKSFQARGRAASSSLRGPAFVLRIAPDLLIPWKMAEPIPDTTNEVYTP